MSFIIQIRALKKKFKNNVVLDGVSFDVKSGESYVVIGCSGAGKSVLSKCMLGLIPYDSGAIQIDNQLVSSLSDKKAKKILKCGVLSQGGALFDSLNILDNITFGLIYGMRMPVLEAKKIAIEKLYTVDLDEKIASVFPAEISGGMKKRVALARAIATDPDIIFFDEPTTGLDPITSRVINDLIVRCTKQMGITAITITHDVNSMKYIGDKIGLLHEGKIIWEGSGNELLTTKDKNIREFVQDYIKNV